MTIVIVTTILILLCLLIILLVMLQRTSGGMGSALGGGAADQVLGAGSGAQLTKMTVWSILGFFILSFALYVSYQMEAKDDGLQRTSGTPPAVAPGPSGDLGTAETSSIPEPIDTDPLPEAPPAPAIPDANDNPVPEGNSTPASIPEGNGSVNPDKAN
ncbi:MAG: preprotein translocase subunit SecG [Opitutae bacterium]|nr:preprotein translocase subunit SecG [Opitutae bacterium]|tara:strand:+ start:4422 stop:4895 length:474 start_codon:yes stop_codon:yes gene_type:complete